VLATLRSSATARSLWGAWVLASACGGALVGAAQCTFWVPAMLLFGPLLALPQALVLAEHSERARRWLAATALGVPIGWVAGLPVGLAAMSATVAAVPYGSPIAYSALVASTLVLPGAAAGAAAGAVQRAALLTRPSASTWLLTCALGGAILAPLAAWTLLQAASGMGDGCRPILAVPPPVAGVVSGAAYGALTGVPLSSAIGVSGTGPWPARRWLWPLLAVAIGLSLLVGLLRYDDTIWGTGPGSFDVERVPLAAGRWEEADPPNGWPAQTSAGPDASGNSYVLVSAGQRIEKRGPDGTLLASFGPEGAAPTGFARSFTLALGDGHLHVAERGVHWGADPPRIHKLTLDGQPVGWVRLIARFDNSGPFEPPHGIAAGPDGTLYALMPGRERGQLVQLARGLRPTRRWEVIDHPSKIALGDDGAVYVGAFRSYRLVP
jgi:hypothetical protein